VARRIPGRRPSGDARRRQLNGAERGGEATRSAFAQALTRQRFAERVGVNVATVRRWELAGAVSPRIEVILGSPTHVFDDADVEFGRNLIAVLRARSGEVSIKEAAAMLRRG
jgi:hypothetical protein